MCEEEDDAFALALLVIVPTLAGSAPQESPRQPLLRTINLAGRHPANP